MEKQKKSSISYADAGVDIDRGNAFVEKIKPAVKATHRAGVAGELGGFGGLFDLKACGYVDPLLVSATDGVGTKLRLAIDSGIYDTVGIDLVAMCVNDIIVQGAEPLFFLDYFASGKLEIDVASAVVNGIAEGCLIAGAALIGGETAEMPSMYADADFDLAGFSVGAVERGQLITGRSIVAGDTLIGLASSGVHSNGFSLVRRVLEQAAADGENLDERRRTLLTPTQIYVKPILQLLKHLKLKGIAHITGGGITENLPRVLPSGIGATIDLNAWSLPEVFQWLMASGPVSEEEMLRTFNCGIGLIISVDKGVASECLTRLNDLGETAWVIGETTDSSNGVSYLGQLQP